MLESLKAKRGVPGRKQREAREALKKSKEVVELLDLAFTLMAEDDPAQPAAAHLYVALWEAEIRANTLEDWYGRTYGTPERAREEAHGAVISSR